jgi:hypothetical protein
MNFVGGVLVGLFFGGIIGVLLISLLVVAGD